VIMGKEVHVLPRAITLRSRAMAIELVVFVYGSVKSLVGTLNGLCPVHQLDLQFVFGSVRVLVGTLSGLCLVRQDVFVAPQFMI